MARDIDNILSLPLSSLTLRTRNLLACLLDSPKIFPSEGPVKLPRDWSGLASLVNISAEVATSIRGLSSKTSKVLDIWIQRQDGTATVGQLLNYLQQIDRYDVHDDILQDLKEHNSKGTLIVPKPANQVLITYTEPPPEINDNDLITYDDRPDHLQQYHAFVLHAKEDKEFVDELISRLTGEGFNLCTVDNLLPGHATQYAPVAQLFQRCQRIILVYSPEFLVNFTNSFYRDYAQAFSIEKNQRKILPIMYRDCQLPVHLTYYHNLYYKTEGTAMIDFWQKLRQSLDNVRMLPRLESPQSGSMLSNLKIMELLDDNSYRSGMFLPIQPTRSISMSELENMKVNGKDDKDDSKSMTNVSQISQISAKKKKHGKIRNFINTLTKKKCKNTLLPF